MMNKRFLMVLIAAIYAMFSSSTPDHFGFAEAAMGLFLVLLVGIRGAASTMSLGLSHGVNFLTFLRISFIFLLLVPTTYGLLWRDNYLMDWVRDVIPLFYGFLPVLLAPYFKREPNLWLRSLCIMLTGIGCAFSVRFFLIDGFELANLGKVVIFGDMNYFPMDPSVTFGAIFALLEALRAADLRKYRQAILWAVLSTLCVASLAATVVRAPLILYAIVLTARVLLIKSTNWAKRLVKIVLVFSLVVTGVFALPLIDLIGEKFMSAGLNMKDLEIREVINFSTGSLTSFAFGIGWGGKFISPAVGIPVRFVHNFPIYLLLKGGIAAFLIGLAIIARVYGGITRRWLRSGLGVRAVQSYHPSVLGAALVVFSSSFFLQANFKSFSFGLVLSVALLTLGIFNKRTRKISFTRNY
jgi:hypothetical protein